MKAKIIFKGGAGSGHHGHQGRPGQQGGSTSSGGGGGGGAAAPKPKSKHSDWTEFVTDSRNEGTYAIPAGKTIWVKTGMRDTNASYGSSRISTATYAEVKTGKGDKVIVNPGGMWYSKANSTNVKPVQFVRPDPNPNPFEKNYSGDVADYRKLPKDLLASPVARPTGKILFRTDL